MIDLSQGPNLLLYGKQSTARDLLGASIQDDLRKHAPSGPQETLRGRRETMEDEAGVPESELHHQLESASGSQIDRGNRNHPSASRSFRRALHKAIFRNASVLLRLHSQAIFRQERSESTYRP